MKKVVSISLGSAKRDHHTLESIGGETFEIKRIGTNGDKRKAFELIAYYDGNVDAIGLGGTDLYIYAGNKRYTFHESARLAAAAKVTPVVDGSGIKNTLERQVVKYLNDRDVIDFNNKSVLVVCAVDRFGLAQALVDAGSQVVFGDLLFGLGLPIPLRSLNSLNKLAKLVAPVVTKFPVQFFYPMGEKQEEFNPRFERYFYEADVIAGDFHYIRRYMPDSLANKIVITNTITAEDEQLLRERGVSILVTTTPQMGGRSFGTNILEGVLVALSGKRMEQSTWDSYASMLGDIGVEPYVKYL